jgi:hypothetical protein
VCSGVCSVKLDNRSCWKIALFFVQCSMFIWFCFDFDLIAVMNSKVDLLSGPPGLPPVNSLDPNQLKDFSKDQLKAYLSHFGANPNHLNFFFFFFFFLSSSSPHIALRAGVDPAVSKPNLKHQLRTIIDSVKRTGTVTVDAFDQAQQHSVTEQPIHFIQILIDFFFFFLKKGCHLSNRSAQCYAPSHWHSHTGLGTHAWSRW